jgi:glutamine amidotransferase
MIAVVDYGMGNVGSVLNMLKRLGVKASLASTEEAVREAPALILPGVGAFGAGMRALEARRLIDPLTEAVINRGTPILGICLGMQLFTEQSDEDHVPGLGWLPAKTVRFDSTRPDAPSIVPHMGWNEIQVRGRSAIFRDLETARFYFVHSYHVTTDATEIVIADTTHGYPFVSAVARDNIYGVQFHPEKSHRFGLAILRNFAMLSGATGVPPTPDPHSAGSRTSAL